MRGWQVGLRLPTRRSSRLQRLPAASVPVGVRFRPRWMPRPPHWQIAPPPRGSVSLPCGVGWAGLRRRTMGSFGQSVEIRRARARLGRGELSETDYETLMREEIKRVVDLQE